MSAVLASANHRCCILTSQFELALGDIAFGTNVIQIELQSGIEVGIARESLGAERSDCPDVIAAPGGVAGCGEEEGGSRNYSW